MLTSWAPTPTTHAIRLERPHGFRFKAGQHVMLQLATRDGEDDRFLSIASSPTRDDLVLAVRRSDSPFKQAFAALAPGDQVTLVGPSGKFLLEPAAPAVFVSGGIGITPIKSMVEQATDEGLSVPVVLVYGNRSPREIVFRDELDDLVRTNPHLRIAYTVDATSGEEPWNGRTGHVDAAMIQEEAAGLEGAHYYTCGPPGMVAAIAGLLETAGVGKDRLHTENFTGY
ncbi:MAG: ferredoxin--NADP reductase [bacterium]